VSGALLQMEPLNHRVTSWVGHPAVECTVVEQDARFTPAGRHTGAQPPAGAQTLTASDYYSIITVVHKLGY